MIFLFLILILLLFLYPFLSKRISPIPYFPSNKKDVKLIIKALELKNNQVIYDLGAGGGFVIFEASKEAKKRNLNTKFIAVELNPILIFIMQVRRLTHPNRINIKIMYSNIFNLTIQPSNHTTIYLYISPWHMTKVISNLKKQLLNFSIVSYYYPLPKLKAKTIMSGKNKIFVYNF